MATIKYIVQGFNLFILICIQSTFMFQLFGYTLYWIILRFEKMKIKINDQSTKGNPHFSNTIRSRLKSVMHFRKFFHLPCMVLTDSGNLILYPNNVSMFYSSLMMMMMMLMERNRMMMMMIVMNH